jgi:hypothetical protein
MSASQMNRAARGRGQSSHSVPGQGSQIMGALFLYVLRLAILVTGLGLVGAVCHAVWRGVGG